MSPVSRRLVTVFRALAIVLIGLHLAVPLLGEPAAWGLWPATYLPTGWRWALALLAVAVVLAGDRLAGPPAVTGPGLSRFRLAAAAFMAVPFYLLRTVHTRWGDAHILVNSIPHPQARLTYTWQAPLDVFLHAKVWAVGQRLFGWTDAMPAYWLLSTLAGVAFVWLLLGLANWLGRNTAERVLIAGLVATLGTMQLFFGYIENYTLMTVGVLAYGWLALKSLRGDVAPVWPALVLAVTHAFHPSTLVLVPSLLYVAWSWHHPATATAPGRAASRKTTWLLVALPYLGVGLAVLALMTAGGHGLASLLSSDFPGGGDRRWFVPLFQAGSRWERYTMFSPGHLLDIVNEQLLAGPVVLPSLILLAILAWRRLPLSRATSREPVEVVSSRFLLIAAAGYFLLTLVWNPDYGGQRDWDLFAPALVPAALLLSYWLPRALPEAQALRGAGAALLAAQAFHTIAWVYQNTRPWNWP